MQSFRMLLALTLVTGVVYPLLVTFAAQFLFSRRAEGSLIVQNHHVAGSELLGQNFNAPKYFWPRPSASDYNALPSGGSNLGAADARLQKAVEERRAALRQAHRLNAEAEIPEDLLFASGSGLDPHISPAAARLQIDRVAGARNFDAAKRAQLAALVERLIAAPQFGFLGAPRINVLQLNLALDSL